MVHAHQGQQTFGIWRIYWPSKKTIIYMFEHAH
jgi:hypothetical protein